MIADRVSKIALTLGIGAAGLLVVPGVASAQEPPLRLEVGGELRQGGTVSVRPVDLCDDGDDTTRGGEVNVRLLHDDAVVEDFAPVVDNNGLWDVRYTFLLTAPTGTYVVQADCTRPGSSTPEPYEEKTLQVGTIPQDHRAEASPGVVKPGDVATVSSVDPCPGNLKAPRWFRFEYGLWYLGPDGAQTPVEADTDITFSFGPPDDPAIPYITGHWILSIVAPQTEGTYQLRAACYVRISEIGQVGYSAIYTPVPFAVSTAEAPAPPPATARPGRPQLTG